MQLDGIFWFFDISENVEFQYASLSNLHYDYEFRGDQIRVTNPVIRSRHLRRAHYLRNDC